MGTDITIARLDSCPPCSTLILHLPPQECIEFLESSEEVPPIYLMIRIPL